ncbi:MAG: efflux transporter outer membrane subunit, partial [Thermodesulfobacteriota bacterium]|nr:efflux transporter outer membrane subunit [Thermodesulfobacteriota bacterium]
MKKILRLKQPEKMAMNSSFGVQTTRQDRYLLLSILLTAVMLLINGCAAVGPDYTRVDPAAPEAWHTELQGGLTAEQTDPANLARWWTILEDSQLAILEERAITGNLDLQVAQARIREARAMRGINRAQFFPTLDSDLVATKSRSSESSGTGTERDLYSVGFDANWELDIFGGVKRSMEAAQDNLEAAREDRHDLLVSLLAEVALNYLEVRTYQSRLEVGRANIKIQQESYKLNHSRFQAGIIGELAVQESLRILASSRSQIPTLEIGLEAAKNRLAVLLGERPGSLHKELATKQPLPPLPITIAVGIPAETLRHRPDIRRAERELAAQTARIGVATADLYPKFRLSGTLGLEALSLGDLLQTSSKTLAIGPRVSWNIFSAGAIRQNIEIQNARQEQALIHYELTVLRALEEVENTLVAYAKEQQKRDFIAKAAVAAEQAEKLADEQYRAGLVSFNNVLDAQRALLILRDELVRNNGTV